ncbi:uncharacterized protein LOC131637655 [Vicia villosa]|uniref:uncharacterized protein LOC131637655 n=1 Tax=Vicia villosa TaxID=3911 RepID=UPI00273C2197|nr:uncharacterized protein LOC131637655 [Vicia villosa]
MCNGRVSFSKIQLGLEQNSFCGQPATTALPQKKDCTDFGLLNSMTCCFCDAIETLNHLLFECTGTKAIWQYVLDWLQIHHVPLRWNEEMRWMMARSKGKGSNLAILKCAFTETVYETWMYRNKYSFGNHIVSSTIGPKIVDIVIYRCWMNHKLRQHIAKLMMP